MTEIFQVAHRATSLCILVAQHLFLVVPGVRATTLLSPVNYILVGQLVVSRLSISYQLFFFRLVTKTKDHSPSYKNNYTPRGHFRFLIHGDSKIISKFNEIPYVFILEPFFYLCKCSVSQIWEVNYFKYRQ